MVCKIVHQGTLKDLKNLDKKQAERILQKIDNDLANNPGKDKGLTGIHQGLFSYRVGDYRVIYELLIEKNENEEEEPVISILKIDHRRKVYK